MLLSRQLQIQPGITAVTGSGGKTALLQALAQELAAEGRRVLLCTTTKIRPFPNIPWARSPAELASLSREHRLLCAGRPAEEPGKITDPGVPLESLRDAFDYILTEADGSRGLPLKAHAPWEPVIPPGAGTVIQVLGASGFGRPIREAVHRPELYARLAGVSPEHPATAETEAAVLLAEGQTDTILLMNQAEDPASLETARALARLLGRPLRAGSIRERRLELC